MVSLFRTIDGKFQVRFTLPLDSLRQYKVNRITSLRDPYYLCTLPLLFSCLLIGIFNVFWEACPFVAMEVPNPPNASAPTSLALAEIVLRGSGDVKIDNMISLWLPAGGIDFAPCAEGHHSCTTGVPNLYNPRTIAGPIQMASNNTTKEGTQLP